MWDKFKTFVGRIWSAIVHMVKELFAFVTDYQWHLDGYKIAGFGAFGFAAWLATQTVQIAQKPELAGSALTLSGLVTVFSGVGYFMFGHAKTLDNTMALKEGQPVVTISGGN
jgi:hypothetical protein